jgi:hypothetical protein
MADEKKTVKTLHKWATKFAPGDFVRHRVTEDEGIVTGITIRRSGGVHLNYECTWSDGEVTDHEEYEIESR